MNISQETSAQLARLLGQALQDPNLLHVVINMFQLLCKDTEVMQAVSHLTTVVVQQPAVIEVAFYLQNLSFPNFCL